MIFTAKRLCSLFALLGLAACSGNVKETLGVQRVAPDEFRVVSRPPLTVPPQFTLAPPDIDANPPGQLPTTQRARSMVLGTPSGTGPEMDAQDAGSQPALAGNHSDSLFLQQAGATDADPNIRRTLVEERVTTQITEEQEGWWEKLSIQPKPSDPTVNPAKEAERIQQNEDTGKPVTEGETPVVKEKDRGILGRILGDD